jgi:hypothetical protein
MQFPQIGSFLCFAIKHQIFSSINNHLTSLNIKKNMKHTFFSKKKSLELITYRQTSLNLHLKLSKKIIKDVGIFPKQNPMGVCPGHGAYG